MWCGNTCRVYGGLRQDQARRARRAHVEEERVHVHLVEACGDISHFEFYVVRQPNPFQIAHGIALHKLAHMSAAVTCSKQSRKSLPLYKSMIAGIFIVYMT